MAARRKNPKVGAFLRKAKKWREEMTALRSILLGCPLTEELKWGKPCYTIENSNVGIIQGFKEYCALLFPKGVLLKDPNGILSNKQRTYRPRGNFGSLAFGKSFN